MIFVVRDRMIIDGQICLDYCMAMGYQMCGVVCDDWREVCDYLWRRECDVVVVADSRSLDPERAPRVEVVAHHRTRPQRPDVPTGHRAGKHRKSQRETERTRRVTRTAAG